MHPIIILGWIQSGIYVNMWVCSVDGVTCFKLTDFDQRGGDWPNGYTGPAVSPDGQTVVWSQITGEGKKLCLDACRRMLLLLLLLLYGYCYYCYGLLLLLVIGLRSHQK